MAGKPIELMRPIARLIGALTCVDALRRCDRDDFERGRSVQLEGWILSRTEAEICALTLLDG